MESTATATAEAPAGDWADAVLAQDDASFAQSAEAAKAPEPTVAKVAEQVAEKTEARADLTPEQILEAARKIKHKIKFNGVEEELDYDDLIRRSQVEKLSREKIAEAQNIAKRTVAFQEKVKAGDLKGAFNELGISAEQGRELLERTLYKELQQDALTPEQKEAAALKARIEAMEAEKAEREKSEAQKKAEAEATQWREKISGELIEAAKENGYDPARNNEIMQIAVAEMIDAQRAGYDLPVKDAMKAATARFESSVKSAIGKLDGDALLRFLGDDILDKAQKAKLAKLNRPAAAPVIAKPKESAKPEAPKYQSPREKRDAERAERERIMAAAMRDYR